MKEVVYRVKKQSREGFVKGRSERNEGWGLCCVVELLIDMEEA